MKTLAIGVMLMTALAVGPLVAAAGPAGMVRVLNRTDVTVTVFVLGADFYGNRVWRPQATVTAGSYLDLPNIPAGTTVGAQSLAKGASKQQWPPVRVDYSGRPIFEYVVR
jgi:hypothetical protein